MALAALGALVVPDEPRAGLNAALRHGAAYAAASWPGEATAAAVPPTCPRCGPNIGRALCAAAAWPIGFVGRRGG